MTSLIQRDAAPEAWQVGDWRVDAAANELRRGAETLRLERKAIDVLICLARRAGHVVSRDELLAAVWPGLVVGDDVLTQAVIKLRKALGDDARHPAYIETISKRGYRLIVPASPTPHVTAPAQAGTGSIPSMQVPAAPPQRRAPWLLGAAATVAMAVAVGIGWHFDRPRSAGQADLASSPPNVAVLPLENLSGDPKRDYFSNGIDPAFLCALALRHR